MVHKTNYEKYTSKRSWPPKWILKLLSSKIKIEKPKVYTQYGREHD